MEERDEVKEGKHKIFTEPVPHSLNVYTHKKDGRGRSMGGTGEVGGVSTSSRCIKACVCGCRMCVRHTLEL